MEYSEGKILEGIIDEKLAPIQQQLNWIIKSMIDNGAVPKEDNKNKEADNNVKNS